MLTIGKKFLKALAKALNNEPSLRPETAILAEQLQVIVIQLAQDERREQAKEEW